MGWLQRVFSNPSKTIGDITSFGFTALGREVLPKSWGGGQRGVFAKSSEVIGATTTGVGVGFLTGGPGGAIVGGASGFGRGISGVFNTESGTKIFGGSAKWSAITGSLAGAIQGTGAAGIVRNVFYKGVPKLIGPELPKVTETAASSSGGFLKGFSDILPLAFLSQLTKQGIALLPGSGQGSTGVTLNSPGSGPGVTDASRGPQVYPGVPSELQTLSPSGIGPAATGMPFPNNYLTLALLGIFALLLLKRKKVF